jgi:uncharacterized protein YeaO (DUF488 family)
VKTGIGTVRRPPRGVPKSEYAKRDLYDVWLPSLAPSEALLKAAQASLATGDEQAWKAFVRRYRGEMKQPDHRALLDTLAALSHTADYIHSTGRSLAYQSSSRGATSASMAARRTFMVGVRQPLSIVHGPGTTTSMRSRS